MTTKCPLPKGFSGTKRVFGILVGLLMLALMAAPGAGAAPFAYVSNMTSGTVTVLDGTTVLATVPVGPQPVGVAVNPAGTRVYVANSNVSDAGVPSVSVIDTASLTETKITAGIVDQPSGVAVSADGRFVYVTTNNGWLHVIETATNTVLAATKTGEQLGAIVAAGGSVYAVDVFFGTVINVTNPTVPPFFVSTMVSGIAANTDGSRLYVSNGNDFDRNLEITVIDTTKNPMQLVDPTTLVGGLNPVQIGTADNDSGLNPAGITVSASGFVYAAITAEHSVEVRNAATMAFVMTIGLPVATAPLGISVDPSGPSVYVVSVPRPNTTNGFATLIDGTTNTVVQAITISRNPMVFGSFVASTRPIPPPPQFVLSLNKVGSGRIEAGPEPLAGGKYSAGTPVNLKAIPDAGFAFTGWSGDCSGTADTCTVVMDRPRNVTATFMAQYTLYPTVLGPGTVTPTGGKYLAGTVVTLTAAPATDAVFVGWSGDACGGSSSLTCDVTMDRTKSVTATFALKQFALTLKKDGTGSGAITASPSLPTYNSGAVVGLTATADPGSQFTRWSGDACAGSTSPTCSVTMSAAQTVTATFTLLPPPPPPPAPTTCDDKIKDLQKKVESDKHPWRHDHQLKAALRLYSAAQIELGKAKVKVGGSDKRYVRALKEFNDGKAALCNGRYWHAHHELWESYYIAHEILKQHRR